MHAFTFANDYKQDGNERPGRDEIPCNTYVGCAKALGCHSHSKDLSGSSDAAESVDVRCSSLMYFVSAV